MTVDTRKLDSEAARREQQGKSQRASCTYMDLVR